MIETDCPTCTYPVKNSRHARLAHDLQDNPMNPFNVIHVPNFGNIPVVKGDLTWVNGHVMNFLNENIALMKPCAVRICNGSVYEASDLKNIVVKDEKTDDLKNLNHLCIHDSSDCLDDVYVVTNDRNDAEPTFNLSSQKSKSGMTSNENQKIAAEWISQKNFQFSKEQRFIGCMAGRVMYVIPFSMGPIGGRHSVYGIQLTDDPILVLNLRCIFRVSSSVWDAIGVSNRFTKSVHSIGVPRPIVRTLLSSPVPSSSVGSFIVHHHEDNVLWAFGSSFGRNEKIGKRLSLGSLGWTGSRSGWLCSNAAIISITGPSKETIHVCYSSSIPLMGNIEHASLPGWKVETIGCPNGSVFIHWRSGKMYAVGTENDEMMAVGSKDNLKNLMDGTAVSYEVYSGNPQNSKWTSDVGVPITGIVFENGRTDQVPIIIETNSWTEGVVLAAAAKVSLAKKDQKSDNSPKFERNPLGMKGYLTHNFGKMIEHWLQMGKSSDLVTIPIPSIFMLNLKQENDGKTIWPGGIENLRIFEHIYKRISNPADESNITKYAIGKLPKELNFKGLDASVQSNWSKLVNVDVRFWMKEVAKMNSFFEYQTGLSKPKQVEQVIADLSSKM